MQRLIFFTTLVTFVLASPQKLPEINTNEILGNVTNKFGVNVDPELVNKIENIDVNQVTSVLKDKCVQVSGSDAAYEEAEQASANALECIQNIVNFTSIGTEIEAAKPNGNLDTVFNKYCNRRDEAIKCVEDFTESLDPCLTEEEKNQKFLFVNITKSLLEFTCHENGNQIALFIAEEGPECFESKKTHLENCFNKTMGKYTKGETPTLENLPTLVITEEHCHDMNALEKCVVYELEQCKESTPANLVEALFRFVRKETPCKNVKPIAAQSNSSLMHKISSLMMVMTVGLLMI